MLRKIKESIKSKIRNIVVPSGFYFSHKGYCPCCDNDVTFSANHNWLRDYFLCSNCNSIPRERALMLTIQKYYPDWKDLEIHESSPINRGASLKLRKYCKKYTSTQYFPTKPFGSMVGNDRNEDLENQTFQDSVFDIIVTQDVMEHVFNPKRAFSEIARTLKKGGSHIFTVPIINHHKQTEIWATKGQDGNPIFLKTEEYHGNPVDIKGSPVTMHWGFDIVDFIESNSSLDTTVEYIDNLDFGIRAEFIEVFVSKK